MILLEMKSCCWLELYPFLQCFVPAFIGLKEDEGKTVCVMDRSFLSLQCLVHELALCSTLKKTVNADAGIESDDGQ